MAIRTIRQHFNLTFKINSFKRGVVQNILINYSFVQWHEIHLIPDSRLKRGLSSLY